CGTEQKEIEMGDEVTHRFELDIAGNGADDITVDIEVDQRRKESARVHMRLQVAIGGRDGLSVLFVAIEDTGNAAFAADGAGGPLAGPATRGSLERNELRHCSSIGKSNGATLSP